jgi:hypothetical protein
MPAPSWPGGRTGAIFTQRGRAARWVAAAALDVQIARGAGCGVGVLVRYFVLARGGRVAAVLARGRARPVSSFDHLVGTH